MAKPTIISVTGTTDPVAMLLTCIVGVLGLFGIPTLLGWDANTVMAFLGFLGMGAAAWRTLKESKKTVTISEGKEPPKELPETT